MDYYRFMLLLCCSLWTVAYFGLIYRAFKDKSCGMPLTALSFNFSWEIIYPYTARIYAFDTPLFSFYLAWLVFDTILLIAYFLYNFKYYERLFGARKNLWTALSVCVVLFAVGLIKWVGPVIANRVDTIGEGLGSISYIVIAICSVGFVIMHFSRDTADGQSFTIAWAKWLGSAVANGSFHYLVHGSDNWVFMRIVIMIIFIFDFWYVILIYRRLVRAGINPWFRF